MIKCRNYEKETTEFMDSVNQHINHVCCSLLVRKMNAAGFSQPKNIRVKDPKFCKWASDYFPKSFPIKHAGEEMLGLYHVLKINAYVQPDIFMAYCLNELLSKEVHTRMTLGISMLEWMPEHDKWIHKLLASGTDEKHVDEKLHYWEGLCNYCQIFFGDFDFEILDLLNLKQIRKLEKVYMEDVCYTRCVEGVYL